MVVVLRFRENFFHTENERDNSKPKVTRKVKRATKNREDQRFLCVRSVASIIEKNV